MTLRLAIPSKGRLMEETAQWFAARGLTLRRTGSDRGYGVEADGVAGVAPVLLSAGEIAGALGRGAVHLGVTGRDLIREGLADWETQVAEVAPLGFGRADLVIAVPDFWADVESLDDLDAAAAAFRRAHGMRLRIATKYHRLTREFLRAHGVADYSLVDSQGATEGTIRNLAAEAVADITTTGETLRANGLRVLSDGLILRSEAVLYAARGADWDGAEGQGAEGDGAARGTLARLCAALGAAVPQV